MTERSNLPLSRRELSKLLVAAPLAGAVVPHPLSQTVPLASAASIAPGIETRSFVVRVAGIPKI